MDEFLLVCEAERKRNKEKQIALKFNAVESFDLALNPWDGFEATVHNPWLLIYHRTKIVARENVQTLFCCQGPIVLKADMVKHEDAGHDAYALRVWVKDEFVYFPNLSSWLLFCQNIIAPSPLFDRQQKRWVYGVTTDGQKFLVSAWRKGNATEQAEFLNFASQSPLFQYNPEFESKDKMEQEEKDFPEKKIEEPTTATTPLKKEKDTLSEIKGDFSSRKGLEEYFETLTFDCLKEKKRKKRKRTNCSEISETNSLKSTESSELTYSSVMKNSSEEEDIKEEDIKEEDIKEEEEDSFVLVKDEKPTPPPCLARNVSEKDKYMLYHLYYPHFDLCIVCAQRPVDRSNMGTTHFAHIIAKVYTMSTSDKAFNLIPTCSHCNHDCQNMNMLTYIFQKYPSRALQTIHTILKTSWKLWHHEHVLHGPGPQELIDFFDQQFLSNHLPLGRVERGGVRDARLRPQLLQIINAEYHEQAHILTMKRAQLDDEMKTHAVVFHDFQREHQEKTKRIDQEYTILLRKIAF
jgi:hypothetical protein